MLENGVQFYKIPVILETFGYYIGNITAVEKICKKTRTAVLETLALVLEVTTKKNYQPPLEYDYHMPYFHTLRNEMLDHRIS